MKGVELSAVEVSSSAWNMGLRAGDRFVSINGQEPEDALDLRFLLSTDSEVDLVVINGKRGDIFHAAISDPESFLSGLEFERMEVKRCTNDCIYCFCKQNPPKARSSLFFRDEDFRMSFLAGTYTTMSSIGEKQLDRIIRQRLSPQYITVPSTNEELRRHILGVKRARPIKEVLRNLLSSDITLHLQTVVIPELNDGAALESTISDLFLMEEVESLAIVPVGTTKYTTHPEVRRPTIEEFSQLLRQVRKWKRKKPGTDGVSWIEASDEIYLALGLPVPSRRKYGEFPQLSTGVGMVRTFIDDYRRLSKKKKPFWWGGQRAVIVSGELFGPTLRRFVSALNDEWGHGLHLVRANNRFFGSEVTVAGLLGGHDIESAVKGIEARVIFLSASCLDHSAERFVDDMTIGEFKEQLGVEVVATGDTLTECFETVTEQLQ